MPSRLIRRLIYQYRLTIWFDLRSIDIYSVFTVIIDDFLRAAIFELIRRSAMRWLLTPPTSIFIFIPRHCYSYGFATNIFAIATFSLFHYLSHHWLRASDNYSAALGLPHSFHEPCHFDLKILRWGASNALPSPRLSTLPLLASASAPDFTYFLIHFIAILAAIKFDAVSFILLASRALNILARILLFSIQLQYYHDDYCRYWYALRSTFTSALAFSSLLAIIALYWYFLYLTTPRVLMIDLLRLPDIIYFQKHYYKACYYFRGIIIRWQRLLIFEVMLIASLSIYMECIKIYTRLFDALPE